ncbi:MAG: hypothetical protein KAW86_05510, partial [Bacteroidales bacterium]|nr:hypothetical protein [Bacteroidales bacterium]
FTTSNLFNASLYFFWFNNWQPSSLKLMYCGKLTLSLISLVKPFLKYIEFSARNLLAFSINFRAITISPRFKNLFALSSNSL